LAGARSNIENNDLALMDLDLSHRVMLRVSVLGWVDGIAIAKVKVGMHANLQRFTEK
jgi:hypothetical protein